MSHFCRETFLTDEMTTRGKNGIICHDISMTQITMRFKYHSDGREMGSSEMIQNSDGGNFPFSYNVCIG